MNDLIKLMDPAFIWGMGEFTPVVAFQLIQLQTTGRAQVRKYEQMADYAWCDHDL